MVSLSSFVNKHYKILFLIFLLFAGTINYWDSFKNPFIIDDSDHYLNAKKQNPKFFPFLFVPTITNNPGFENYENVWHYYRPFHHFLMSLESSLFGDKTLYYQITSLILFVLACFSVFLLLSAIGCDCFVASAAALLYLLHPFNGLCVNYKTAFVFSIQIIFLNLILIHVHQICNKELKFRWSQFLLYLVLFFFALLLNEIAFVFPLVLLVYFLSNRCFNKESLIVCLGFFLLSLLCFFIRSKLSDLPGGFFGAMISFKITWFESCAAYARIIRWVLLRFFDPENIYLQWATLVDKYMAVSWFYVFGFYVFTFVFFAWLFNKRNRMLLFFWLMFSLGFVLAAPATFNMLGTGFFYFEPHWIFYTNIGFFGLASWLIYQTRLLKPWLPYLVMVCISLFLGFFSYKQNKLYNEPIKLYTQWSENIPAYDLPSLLLCTELLNVNKTSEAINCLESNTDTVRKGMAYSNLGALYYRRGEFKKSKIAFEKVLEINPADVASLIGLAAIGIEEKEYDKSILYITRAQMYDVFSIDLIQLKCFVLEKQKKYDQIFEILDEVDRLYFVKDFSDIYRVRLLFTTNRDKDAINLSNKMVAKSKNMKNLFQLIRILRINSQHDLANRARNKILNHVNLRFYEIKNKILIIFDI